MSANAMTTAMKTERNDMVLREKSGERVCGSLGDLRDITELLTSTSERKSIVRLKARDTASSANLAVAAGCEAR
jgi:hypothetical protein